MFYALIGVSAACLIVFFGLFFVRQAIARRAFERIYGFPARYSGSIEGRQERVDLVLTGLEVNFLTASEQYKSLVKSSATLTLRSEARALEVCAHQRYFWATTLARKYGFDIKHHSEYLDYLRH